jgi:hypothetical protein
MEILLNQEPQSGEETFSDDCIVRFWRDEKDQRGGCVPCSVHSVCRIASNCCSDRNVLRNVAAISLWTQIFPPRITEFVFETSAHLPKGAILWQKKKFGRDISKNVKNLELAD